MNKIIYICSMFDLEYKLSCGDCSWCVVNFTSSGHPDGFICSNHPLHFSVKLSDLCHIL